MKSSSTRLAILAGLALTLSIGGASFAQGQYSGPPSGPPGSNGAPSQPPMSQAAYMSQALQAFLAAVAAPSGVAEKMRAQDARMATMPTPQRLDMMLARMDDSRNLMVTRIAATKRFYAQLTPAQQRVFDNLGNQSRGGQQR